MVKKQNKTNKPHTHTHTKVKRFAISLRAVIGSVRREVCG